MHASKAIRNPGQVGFHLRRPTITARPSTVSATAAGCVVPMYSANAFQRGTNSAGTAPIRKPSMSFTWLEKMLTAMPAVKPVITGCGMYFISVPSRNRPAAMSISPASRVHRISPP